MNTNESKYIKELPVRLKSRQNLIELIIIISMCCFEVLISLLSLITPAAFLFIILLLTSIFSIPGSVLYILSVNYSITFNLEDFSYNQLFFKGTVNYSEIEQLYIVKILGKTKDFYRIKVKLTDGRSLAFGLNRLQEHDVEFMENIFTIKTKKSYIHKTSII